MSTYKPIVNRTVIRKKKQNKNNKNVVLVFQQLLTLCNVAENKTHKTIYLLGMLELRTLLACQ